MLSVSKHVKLLSTLFSLVNAGEKTFTLQFFHETRIDEIFPVLRFWFVGESIKSVENRSFVARSAFIAKANFARKK